MDEDRYEPFVSRVEHPATDFAAGLDPHLGTIDLSNLILSQTCETRDSDLRDVESTALGRLLDFLPTPALVLDASLFVVFGNTACGRIAPDVDTVVGQPFASLMPGKRRPAMARSLMRKALLDGKPRTAEVVLGTGKGKIWGRLRMRSLRLGTERGLLVIVEDLTLEKKQLTLTKKYSEEMRKARDELEARVHDRTGALTRANEDLRNEMDARLAVQDALSESEQRYRAVVEDQTELITRFLPDGTITFANGACCRYFGDTCGELKGTNFFLNTHPDDQSIQRERCASLHPQNPVATFQVRVTATGHGMRWHHQTIRAIFDEQGAVKEYQCVATDVTERKRAEEAVKEAKEQWERTFDAVPDLVAIIDSNHRIARVNRAMSAALGVHPQELIGATCHVVFHGMDRPLCECPYTSSMQAGERFVPETIETNLKGRTYAVSVSPLRDQEGRVNGCVHVARDITRRKRLEEELKLRATRDSLTGLFNRSHFLETLSLACATAKRYDQPLSVSILDVDKFKDVNDTHGHLTGDLVLERLGRIVQKELRSSDFAGRFGGDEFIIAFPHSGAQGAAHSVERIRVALAEYVFHAAAGPFHVNATGGVAEFAPQQMIMQDLIQQADVALYRAKNLGRNCVLIYE
jgi:diguanylate cyclase (GGDEF)-like protein/PAS domain S-box-containing protein